MLLKFFRSFHLPVIVSCLISFSFLIIDHQFQSGFFHFQDHSKFAYFGKFSWYLLLKKNACLHGRWLHLEAKFYLGSLEPVFDIEGHHQIHSKSRTFFAFLYHFQKVSNLLSFSSKFSNRISSIYFILNKKFLCLWFYHREFQYTSSVQSFKSWNFQSLYL